LTRPDLIRIDPFSEDSNSLSSLVPSTSKTPPHVRPIHIDHCVGTDTLLSSTPEAPSKIVDPHLHQFIRICKSTKLPDFAYYCYSSLFTSFLASIHCLSKLSSYKKAILDPFLQQAINKELSTLHKIDKTNT
jgi:hypothetical protein